MAMEASVAVERQGDVAGLAAERLAAAAAVQRRRHAAPVEEQDRLAALVCDRAELCQKRRGQRVAGFAPQVDDANGRQRTSEAAAELEAFEPLPAFGARRRASEH